MTNTDVTDPTSTIDAYFAMWNESDVARRRDLIERAWAPQASYLDPLLEADGHDGLSTMVDQVHAQLPGHRFRRTTEIDLHHDRVRFGWELAGEDGTVAVAGIDVGELDGEGRLRRITGFFGDPAAV
jgi:hypothetical protein